MIENKLNELKETQAQAIMNNGIRIASLRSM
jgi:uncharacterized protein YlxW (UPF0749 family)